MKTSSQKQVRKLYDESADSYSEMMDSEIDLPIYPDVLGRLAERIAGIPGPVIDTSCGSGHMLSLYHERYDSVRPLLGVDLSPRMVAIADARLGSSAEILVGDMRDLSSVESGSAAAVLSFYAIHHLGSDELVAALQEWRRVLRPGGQLVVAAWEGNGPIDYGNESDVVALMHSRDEIVAATQTAGFSVDHCVEEFYDDMFMNVVYLEGTSQ